MKKRIQVVLSDEAWELVESITSEANNNFEVGSISYSDVINEMILSAKVDIRSLQLKHTDLRRSLRSLASKDNIDIEQVLKALHDLKGRNGKKVLRGSEEVS